MERDINNSNNILGNVDSDVVNLMKSLFNYEKLEKNKNYDSSDVEDDESYDRNGKDIDHMNYNYNYNDSYPEYEYSREFINILKQNSFMLLKENSNFENPVERNSELNHENKNDEIVEKPQADYICPLCLKNLETIASYEMHAKYCVQEDDPSNWDNFGAINQIQQNSNNNRNDNQFDHVENSDLDYINPNDLNEVHEINENFHNEDNYLANNSYRSPTVSEHDSYDSNQLDYNDPQLDYEELLRLDENIKHPLDKFYLSMLVSEKIQGSTISHLSEELKKCLVCFEDFEVNQKIIRLPCFHIFHEEEIFQWFEENKTCPLCRVDIEELLKKY